LILLSLGTHQQAFTRALDLVEPLARQGSRLLVQHGSTPPRPHVPNTRWIEVMPHAQIVEAMARADGVICHAGIGTIMTALNVGHTPVVIPRQAQHGEHVDDHQQEIATRFAERGLVRCVVEQTDLAALLGRRDERIRHRLGKGSAELRTALARAVAVG
jgi:UDP-N-acetylglucosamine transferase subunit ALG13